MSFRFPISSGVLRVATKRARVSSSVVLATGLLLFGRVGLAADLTAPPVGPTKKEPDPTVAELFQAGLAFERDNQLAKALARYRDAEDLSAPPRDRRNWADLQSHIARILFRLKEYEEVDTVCREALAAYGKLSLEDHADARETRKIWILNLGIEKNFEKAESVSRWHLGSCVRALGPENPETLQARSLLAEALSLREKHPEAEKEYREILAIQMRKPGPDDRLTLATAFKLASVLFTENKIAEARAVLLPAYERFRAIAQPDDPVLEPFHRLARALEQKEEAEKTK